MFVKISEHDEQRLRQLAIGLAQGIKDPADILKELSFSEDDWRELEKSRIFRRLLEQAQAEWNASGRTPDRIKLKAGVSVELSLPQFHQDMNDKAHPLASRVKLLEVISRLAGLPEPELNVGTPGAQFKLEIHLGDNRVETVSIGGAIPSTPTIEAHESFKLPDYLVTLEE